MGEEESRDWRIVWSDWGNRIPKRKAASERIHEGASIEVAEVSLFWSNRMRRSSSVLGSPNWPANLAVV
jgi:hypothetical protein